MLTERQQVILEYIADRGPVSRSEILKYWEEAKKQSVSHMSIVRDLDALLSDRLIVKDGKGPAVRYHENVPHKGLRYIAVERYFVQSADERANVHEVFSDEVFLFLHDIFSLREQHVLEELNAGYRTRTKTLSPIQYAKEIERLTIEFAWKSSHIEGNTYSLLDTEALIKDQKEADGHTKEEAIMILNHKKALDHIRNTQTDFKTLSVRKIEDVHHLIVDQLGIEKGLRKRPVGIIGTRYRPLDDQYRINEAMERLVEALNNMSDPWARAFAAVCMLSYIQPFEDGNKRTARLLGNAILLASEVCPLSYRSVDEVAYKKAMIIFYEQQSFRAFKNLFMEQFEFAVKNYFL
jgi:fido (protein-threonine AMPylation protein)